MNEASITLQNFTILDFLLVLKTEAVSAQSLQLANIHYIILAMTHMILFSTTHRPQLYIVCEFLFAVAAVDTYSENALRFVYKIMAGFATSRIGLWTEATVIVIISASKARSKLFWLTVLTPLQVRKPQKSKGCVCSSRGTCWQKCHFIPTCKDIFLCCFAMLPPPRLAFKGVIHSRATWSATRRKGLSVISDMTSPDS